MGVQRAGYKGLPRMAQAHNDNTEVYHSGPVPCRKTVPAAACSRELSVNSGVSQLWERATGQAFIETGRNLPQSG